MTALQRKLSKERAERIRAMHGEGFSMREIARQMDCDPATVCRVVNRKQWIGTLRERLEAAEQERDALRTKLSELERVAAP